MSRQKVLLDEALKKWATEKQSQYIDIVNEHGSFKRAADVLNINIRTLTRTLDAVRLRASLSGYAPQYHMTHESAPGFSVRGVSTYYDETGEVKGQWVKTRQEDEARLQAMQEAIAALTEDAKGKSVPVKPPKHTIEDLANLYIVTDYHVGMRSWPEETGADWDVDIAEDLLNRWFSVAIAQAPNAKIGILAQLGDFLHWDGLDAITPANHNLLDADTRFQKIVRVAIRLLRHIVSMMLEKHEHVYIIMAEGNHDPASSIWLRELFFAFYENNKRVTVDRNADIYYCYEHGQTSLFFHHGHKRKPSKVDDVFVAKYRKVSAERNTVTRILGICTIST